MYLENNNIFDSIAIMYEYNIISKGYLGLNVKQIVYIPRYMYLFFNP